MNNITSVLLTKAYDLKVEEWGKQGSAIGFDSGEEQRIVKYSIPAIEMTILYRGINFEQYDLLRTAFEENNSSTFNFDIDDSLALGYEIDLRPTLMQDKSSVWAFKDFQFKVEAKTLLYTGKITLVTSVFFNFDAYQDLFTQSSTYTQSPSTDLSFINILTDARPYAVDLKYINNAIFSNIGQSARHARNKGGLRRYWSMYWLLNESNFLKLLTFYRKNSGMMGEFGVPDYGTEAGLSVQYIVDDDEYLENPDDYVLWSGLDSLSNARFQGDSFQYQKRIDGLYQCQADFIEVKL